jgi:hypothetical protein
MVVVVVMNYDFGTILGMYEQPYLLLLWQVKVKVALKLPGYLFTWMDKLVIVHRTPL